MMDRFKTLGFATVLGALATGASAGEYMKVTTDQGVIISQLYYQAAPITVQRIRDIVANGEWDADKKAFFHRSIKNFVVQGGAFGINGSTAKYDLNNTWSNIPNEAGDFSQNIRSNIFGTMAMARFATDNSPSASNQFFYNLTDNSFLDYKDQAGKVGFTVFGFVVNGIENATAINQNTTHNFGRKHLTPNFGTLVDEQDFADIVKRDGEKAFIRDNYAFDEEGGYFFKYDAFSGFPKNTLFRFYPEGDPRAEADFDFTAPPVTNNFKWDVKAVTVNTPMSTTPMSPTFDGNDKDLEDSDFVTFSVEIYTTLDGDTDGDGKVDLQDMFNLRNNYQTGRNLGDTNGDGVVDEVDLLRIRKAFGKNQSSVSTAAIPEPSSIGLLLLAGAWQIRRKK